MSLHFGDRFYMELVVIMVISATSNECDGALKSHRGVCLELHEAARQAEGPKGEISASGVVLF